MRAQHEEHEDAAEEEDRLASGVTGWLFVDSSPAVTVKASGLGLKSPSMAKSAGRRRARRLGKACAPLGEALFSDDDECHAASSARLRCSFRAACVSCDAAAIRRTGLAMRRPSITAANAAKNKTIRPTTPARISRSSSSSSWLSSK